jgi:gliding motility-associated-like protein
VNADAGDYTVVCEPAANLLARGYTIGQGIWSVQSPGQASIKSVLLPATSVDSILPGITIFEWTVVNGACASVDTVSVYYDVMCDLELPDAFSPNGDGFNDGYVVKGLEGYPKNLFRVFNRWGNEVYSKTDYVNGQWVGQNTDGDVLPEATYFVILEVKEFGLRKNTFVDLRRYIKK